MPSPPALPPSPPPPPKSCPSKEECPRVPDNTICPPGETMRCVEKVAGCPCCWRCVAPYGDASPPALPPSSPPPSKSCPGKEECPRVPDNTFALRRNNAVCRKGGRLPVLLWLCATPSALPATSPRHRQIAAQAKMFVTLSPSLACPTKSCGVLKRWPAARAAMSVMMKPSPPGLPHLLRHVLEAAPQGTHVDRLCSNA
eukprot:jgi/Botrbrau1/6803/Bobra.0153s0006.1